METWAEVYHFPKEGKGYASQMEKFATSKFSLLINPKDGYVVADCEDPRERRALEFIVPILYLEKPTQIIVTLSNTIFGALLGVRQVSWGVVLQDLVDKLVFKLEKGKPSPITPYLFYLYNRFECLREGETTMLEEAKYMLEFDIALEMEAKPDPKDEDSERESLNFAEIWKLQAMFLRMKKRSTYKVVDGKMPI